MKTPEQYREEFLKRASIGFLLKHWRARYAGNYTLSEIIRKIIRVEIKDVIWSRESGTTQKHIWTEDEFRVILEQRGHWKRPYQGDEKRKTLAKKYRHGRSKN